jgi:hypothetical protein
MDRIQVQMPDGTSQWAIKSDIQSLDSTLDYITGFADTGVEITPYQVAFFFNESKVRYLMQDDLIQVPWAELDPEIIDNFTSEVLENAMPKQEFIDKGLM